MKVYYKPSAKLTIELEASDQKDLFEQMARLQEIIEHKCGKCKSKNWTFQIRIVDDNKFYELVCGDCGAVLAFGAHKKGGTLFPKRYQENEDGEREWLPTNGWTKWDKEKQKRV